MSIKDQPLTSLAWLPRDALRANTWNPNHQAPTEQALLALSIVENGWTQPIVARRDGDGLEIVDGFHRWLVAARPDVAKLTGGKVPVVILAAGEDEATVRMATIRHNRARGAHGALLMADIVIDLVDRGVPPDEVASRLGMEPEEVSRFLDRGRMAKRGATPDGSFSRAWGSEKIAP
jgi:ParB-like chromosome segregation protein Spo0J